MLTSDVAGTVVAIPSRTTTTGIVEYRGASGSIPAYLARPSGDGAWPAVVVIHDLFGLMDHTRDIAERFAYEGYVTLAPNLFASPELAAVLTPANVQKAMAFMFRLPRRDPVLALYGAEDTRINADLDKLVKAMADYKKDFEMRIYPGAPHAFFNDRNPTTYREAAARDAWDRVLRFYRRTLMA